MRQLAVAALHEFPRREWLLVAAACLGLRLWLVAVYGPLMWPDSSGYISFAETLRSANLSDLLGGHIGLPVLRGVGYSALLALLMKLGGSLWLPLIVGVQIGTSLIMLWWLYRFGVALSLEHWLSAVAAGLFSCAHLACYDVGILTDAMFTHIIIIGVCVFLVPVLEGGAVSVPRAIGCGLLLAVSMLIREATIYFLPVVVMGLAIVMGVRRVQIRAICRNLLLLSLPVVLIWQGYLTWNQARIGVRVVTTVGQSVYLLHPLELELTGIHVLEEPRIYEAYVNTNAGTVFGRAMAINQYIEEAYGLGESEQYFLSEAAFWTAWKLAPLGMVRRTLAEFPPQYAMHIVSLTAALRDAEVIAGRRQPNAATSLLEWRSLPFFEAVSRFLALGPLEIGSRFLSLVIFLAHMVGIPLLLIVKPLRQWCRLRNLDAMVFSWMFFFGIVGMYAMIHIEPRYYMPGQAFAIITGIAVLRHLVLAWLGRSDFRIEGRP